MTAALPPSLSDLLLRRGVEAADHVDAFLSPSLSHLSSPDRFADMPAAVGRLRQAIREEQVVGLYADRDMDGLAGLAVMHRTLRTLGAQVEWDAPREGRGLEARGIESLLTRGAKVVVFIDCGGGDPQTLENLVARGIDVIVADHHRLSGDLAKILAWIHPHGTNEKPAGCVMAFKLAHALWLSFLGNDDPERLDYFLYSHLDVVALGILGDRVPLTGENRVLVWHGLRRLAQTRKTGLSALLRFCRMVPRTNAITVREANWRIIPLLNAAGRLGEPQWAADLLITEDAWTARQCIDKLITLNSDRRAAQDRSLYLFEKAIEEQCAVDRDGAIIAKAVGLEPSVTGLAAQAIARKYGRPAALFVEKEDGELVGSTRGLDDGDLFLWVEAHKELLVKFGGHEGAVGMTVRAEHYETLRERLLNAAGDWNRAISSSRPLPEVTLSLAEADRAWWEALQRLEPFGAGHPTPIFALEGVNGIEALNRRKIRGMLLKQNSFSWPAEWDGGIVPEGAGPWRVIAAVQETPKESFPFKWIIQEVQTHHG